MLRRMSADPTLSALIAQGRFEDAETRCRARLQHDPADAQALGALLPWLMQRGEFLQARVYAETAATAGGPRRDLLLMLGQVRERMRDFAAAQTAYAAAAGLNRDDWIARLFLGDAAAAAGDAGAALTARNQALLAAEREGALAPNAQLPPPLQAAVQRAIAMVQQARAEAFDAALAPLAQRYGEAALVRIRGAIEALVGRRPRAMPHPLQYPSLLCIPDLPPQPWFEREAFAFLAELEAQTAAIRTELLDLLEEGGEIPAYIDMPERAPAAPMWRELNRSPRWRSYHFYRHGQPVAEHLTRCPRTAEALARLPLMQIPDHAPEAMFSLLAPGTEIPPHTGVINGRLTVHLPLVVPPNCGALKAGEEQRAWEEGRCLIFDDSFVHSAWNRSAHLRAVLIFDLWHPGLSEAERAGLSATIETLGIFNRSHDSDAHEHAPSSLGAH
jgi:aspartate beta-hydroxylase